MQRWFAAAKSNAHAPLTIQLLQPGDHLVRMQGCLVLRRIAVCAVKVANISECNGYLTGRRRPNRLFQAQLVQQDIQTRKSIEKMNPVWADSGLHDAFHRWQFSIEFVLARRCVHVSVGALVHAGAECPLPISLGRSHWL